ncbi:radical SAM family heme chaperone HemW [uncultured Helicobacter sp.]|uniref:radical SAM family heme chaperone HemW n=1 Tax=uncultured Helicobacter sp. TaxID=175537 RepID=UPI0025CE692A|nr:radical SAM family heme chaperone HemW [uncultured Helicobacter sp.]
MLLYIHIPFCSSKCGYCAFNSFVDREGEIEAYVRALCEDIRHSLRGNTQSITSIFFGGGTPNFLDSKYYDEIFESIYTNASVAKDCEISLECNVNLLNLAWCKHLLSLGANRLSVGIQSFDENKLAFLQREHKAKDIALNVEYAFSAGFKNVSCDLITNTPLDSKKVVEADITNALNLPISHISVYALSIDEGSRFALDSKRFSQDLESKDDFCFFARELLEKAGFYQYEVSNYAQDSKQGADSTRCKHNLGYWQGKEYIGCGAGAVGRLGNRRMKAYPQLANYIKTPRKRLVEILSQRDLCMENIMLGLRCAMGVKMSVLEELFMDKVAMEKHIGFLLSGGKCHIRQEKREDFLVANELFLSDEIALWLLARA